MAHGDEYESGGPDTPTGGGAGAPVRTVDLGTSVVVYYADGTYQVLPKGQFPRAAAGAAPRQGDPDLGARNAFEASQAALQRAESARQFNERFGMDKAIHQERLGEDARQFNERFGFDKAKFNTEFPVREGELTGYYKGQNTLDRDKLGENSYQFSAQQAFDYYKRLQDMASNPRNFMLNFFQNRGQEAPANVKAYGNTGQRLSAMQSFEDFLPQFLGLQGRGYGRGASTEPTRQQVQTGGGMDYAPPPPPAIQAAAPAAPAGPVFTRNGATSGAVVPTTVKDGTYTPTNTLAATGVPGANTGQTFDLAQFGGTEPAWLRAALSGQEVKKFARGGVIPEPVVGRGVVSGRPYTFGERGPEGVVPSNMLPDFLKKRGGTGSYALGGDIGYSADLYGGDLYAPTAEPPPPTENPYGQGYGGYDYSTMGTAPATRPSTDTSYGQGYGGYDYSTMGPAPVVPERYYDTPFNEPAPTTTAPAPTPFTISPAQQAEMDRILAEQAAQNAQLNSPVPVTLPVTTTLPPLAPPLDAQPPTNVAPPSTTLPPPNTITVPQPVTTAPPTTQPVTTAPPTTAPVQQPGQLPQGPVAPQPTVVAPPPVAPVNQFTGQAQTNRDVSSPGTFGRSIPGGGPKFLPGEDQSSLQALLEAGALPPFLSRLLGQQAGVQSVGTNQGQRFDISPDIPIVSEMALSQMLPSEREAFFSFISSYGLDPSDYLSYVQSLGPTGGSAQAPLFGANLRYNRQ